MFYDFFLSVMITFSFATLARGEIYPVPRGTAVHKHTHGLIREGGN